MQMQHITQMYYLQMQPLVTKKSSHSFPYTVYRSNASQDLAVSSYIRQTYLLRKLDGKTVQLFYMFKVLHNITHQIKRYTA